jgi:hypothetical protein
MTDLPDPLTPPDCDLRGYQFMPLLGHRLFTSDFYLSSTPLQFKVAIKLWWEAWNQKPAGSLPNNPKSLGILAGFVGDYSGFLRIKSRVLHGFVLCSDGRLYHPVICAEAIRVYEGRRKLDEKKNEDKRRQAEWRKQARVTQSVTVTSNVERESKKERKKEERKVPTTSDAPPSSSASAVASVDVAWDARTDLWSNGLAAVRAKTGLPDNKARTLMGLLLRDSGDDCAQIGQAIRACPQTGDPIAWLKKSAMRIGNSAKKRGEVQAMREDWKLPSFADKSLLTDETECDTVDAEGDGRPWLTQRR